MSRFAVIALACVVTSSAVAQVVHGPSDGYVRPPHPFNPRLSCDAVARLYSLQEPSPNVYIYLNGPDGCVQPYAVNGAMPWLLPTYRYSDYRCQPAGAYSEGPLYFRKRDLLPPQPVIVQRESEIDDGDTDVDDDDVETARPASSVMDKYYPRGSITIIPKRPAKASDKSDT